MNEGSCGVLWCQVAFNWLAWAGPGTLPTHLHAHVHGCCLCSQCGRFGAGCEVVAVPHRTLQLRCTVGRSICGFLVCSGCAAMEEEPRRADTLSAKQIRDEMERRGLKVFGFQEDNIHVLQKVFDEEFEVLKKEYERRCVPPLLGRWVLTLVCCWRWRVAGVGVSTSPSRYQAEGAVSGFSVVSCNPPPPHPVPRRPIAR